MAKETHSTCRTPPLNILKTNSRPNQHLNMCGKIILFIILILSHHTATQKTAEIKSGLLFERNTDQPTLINPTYYTFTRRIDLKPIQDSVKLAQKFTDTYEKFCKQTNEIVSGTYADVYVRRYTYKTRYTISEITHNLSDAARVCARDENILPQITSLSELRMIQEIAHDYNVTFFPAGIHYKNDEYRYMATGDIIKPIIDRVSYSSVAHNEIATIYERKRYKNDNEYFLYKITPTEQIIVYAQPLEPYQGRIVCQVLDPVESDRQQNNYLLKITAHVCKKDLKDINNITKIIINETSFFQPITKDEIDNDIQ